MLLMLMGLPLYGKSNFVNPQKIGQGISIDRARLHKVNDCMASNRNATGVRRLS